MPNKEKIQKLQSTAINWSFIQKNQRTNNKKMLKKQAIKDPNESSQSKLSQFDTHDTHNSVTSRYDCCPNCDKRAKKLTYYSCCISPSCQNCYSGFHYLQCSAAKKVKEGAFYSVAKDAGNGVDVCQRCQAKIGDFGYSCKQCKLNVVCEGCSNTLHKGNKFQTHSYYKWKKVEKTLIQNILMCPTHLKPRKSLTQSLQLLCAQCPTKKGSQLPATLNVVSQKSQLECISNSLLIKLQNYRKKWNEKRQELERQFRKINKIVEQRYQQNLALLQQMEMFDMRVIDKVVKQTQVVKRQLALDVSEFGIGEAVFGLRLAILFQKLVNCRAQLVSNQLYSYKIGSVDTQKLQLLLKPLTITKQKQQQDKQNLSTQKPRNTSLAQRPSTNNLSMSRRSLSNSVSKVQPMRNSALRDSTASISQSQNININSNANKSQNVSINVSMGQQNKTQPIRNYTPPFGGKGCLGSSDKKYGIGRQSSMLNSKIEDISPVLLNFDSKQIIGSRINFLSNKTDLDEQNLSLTEPDKVKQRQKQKEKEKQMEQNGCPTRGKRKSDYFQLRDRMRKTNVVNNRFNKR